MSTVRFLENTLQHGYGQFQLNTVIVYHQYAYLLVDRSYCISRLAWQFTVGSYNGDADTEFTTFTYLTVQCDVAIEQFNKFLGDRQSETESFLTLSVVQSGELFENLVLFFLAHAASGIGHTYSQRVLLYIRFKCDTSFGSKFQCVRYQILNDLTQTERVALNISTCRIRFYIVQLQSFLCGERKETGIDILKQLGRIESYRMQIHFPRFQLMIIKQRSDKQKKVLC